MNAKYKPSKIVILREAITKITQILVGKNIKVHQRGLEARVDYDPVTHLPKAVILPMIPDDASDDLCDAVQGFLDHEVAHVLFTDPSVLQKAKRDGLGKLYEVFEDIHAEGKMTETLRGTKGNLECVSMFYLEKFVEPKLKEAIANGDKQAEMALVAPSVLRALSGQWVYKDFLKTAGSEVANELMETLEPLRAQLENVKSSDEAYDLTTEAMRLLHMPPQPPQPEEGEGDEGKGGSKGKGGQKGQKGQKGSNEDKGNGDGDDEAQEESGESPQPGEGDGEGDDGGEQSAAGGGEGEGDQEGDGQSDGSDGDSGEQDGTESAPKQRNSTKPGGHENARSGSKEKNVGNLTWDELAEALKNIKGFDEAASDAVKEGMLEAAKGSDYVIYSNEDDKIGPLKFNEAKRDSLIDQCNRRIEAPVLEMINPLSKGLERAIAARSAAVYVGGKSSGRLHGPGLVQIKFGGTKVFKRKEENKTKDVAVELVIDASGSMSGQKIQTATQAAFALSSVLEKLQIKNEVIAFTTGNECVPHKDLTDAEKRGVYYARLTTIEMPVLKEFNEPLNSTVRARFGALPVEVSMESNVDGESIEYAARRLSRQSASRHVMIVLSDGEPAAYTRCSRDVLMNDLKNRVKRIEGAGIDVVGIGIQSDAVRRFYKKNVVIQNVTELPGVVMHQLRDLLLPS